MREIRKNNQAESILITLVILIPLIVLLSLDAIGNPESIVGLIGLHSHQLVLPALLVLLAYRVTVGQLMGESARKLLLAGFCLAAIIGSALTFYDAVTPPNAVFALTRLHQDQVSLLSMFLGIIFFITQSSSWWKKYWRNVVFWLPFVGFYYAFLTSLFPFDVFLQIIKEDHLLEYLQFLTLFLGSLTSLWIALQLHKIKQLSWSLFFGVCSVAFFLVAGDEIAWGQRILNIEVSEAIKQVNRQEEITIHNLHAVEWMVLYGYFSLSVLGVFSHLICSKFAMLNRFVNVVPKKLLVGYFLLPCIFYIAQLSVAGGVWHAWSEVAELYFYSGLVLWILLLGQEKTAI